MIKMPLLPLCVMLFQPILGQNVSPLIGNKSLKETIDINSLNNWEYVDRKPVISNDGSYVSYIIKRNYTENGILKIQNLNTKNEISFPYAFNLHFSNDSKKAAFMLGKDSLCLVTLNNFTSKIIEHISSFQLFTFDKTEWLIYLSNNKKLILNNLITNIDISFDNVSEYVLSKRGNSIVLKIEDKKSNQIKQFLQWYDIKTAKSNLIWEGYNTTNLIMDDKGVQLAFKANIDSSSVSNNIWLYKTDFKKAICIVQSKLTGVDSGFQINSIKRFSKDSRRLFIDLKEEIVQPKVKAVQVDIWNYLDPKLQEQQLNELKPQNYLAVVPLDNPHILQLQNKNDEIISTNMTFSDDYILFENRPGERSEIYWNIAAQPTYYLVSTKSGNRKIIQISKPTLSPSGKYIIGYDSELTLRNICIYDIATGETKDLTSSLPITSDSINNDEPGLKHSLGLFTLAWIKGDAAVLISDKYDIWKIDPTMKRAPFNLTNGRSVKTIYGLAGKNYIENLKAGEEIILTSLQEETMDCGFYQITLGKQGKPQYLTSGKFIYSDLLSGYFRHNSIFPLKAKNANVYLIMRESANQSPNIFWTENFKSFFPVSNVYPERKYNWIRSKLLSYKTLDNIPSLAVLYIPENFTEEKKYPVILNYYEKNSFNLNMYPKPGSGYGVGGIGLDIGWFVSHEYLVLLIDIQYKIGEPGKSVYNSVLSLTNYISKLHFVDTAHIGIQGHSFGGWETNYLVTHTDRFAAALSSSGMSDMISNFSSLWQRGNSTQEYFERRSPRIGTTPWQEPDLYFKNSPIFFVDKVTTPILILHNKKDKNVLFTQGVQFFSSLRRAGKKAWMLQYDNGGHGVAGEDYADYTFRVTQFFDHYLKGKIELCLK